MKQLCKICGKEHDGSAEPCTSCREQTGTVQQAESQPYVLQPQHTAAQKKNKKRRLLISAIGFGCCAAVNLAVFAFTWFVLPVLSMLYILVYAVLFIPFMIFSAMLTWNLLKKTKLQNRALSIAYKITAFLLIWFIAFFPFSMFGLQNISSLPGFIAKEQEASLFKEEIINSETYADLSAFGLGVYKRINEGDERIWDITQPINFPSRISNGTIIVYASYSVSEDRSSLTVGSDKGKDLMYDVCLYEGIYIIIPLSDSGFNYFYLCKGLDKDSELFYLSGNKISSKAMEELRKLPGKRYSRKEIAEKLGNR